MRMKRNWYGGIGSVSSATMRPQDLIPSFIWEAKNLRLTKDERKIVSAISARIPDNKDAEYWTGDESSWDLDSLFDILDAHSLPYFSFGAHPGDGADYGWWLSEGFEDEFDGLKVSDTSDVPAGYTGEVLLVNDHGNCTLFTAKNGRLHEVWAIV